MELKEALEILNNDLWNWLSESSVIEPKELEALQIAIDCVKEVIKEEKKCKVC